MAHDSVAKGDILRAKTQQVFGWQRLTQGQFVAAVVILLVNDKTKRVLVGELMNDARAVLAPNIVLALGGNLDAGEGRRARVPPQELYLLIE